MEHASVPSKLSDVRRTGVSKAFVGLKSMGIKTAMLTGDNHASAMNVDNQVNTYNNEQCKSFVIYLFIFFLN